MAREYCVYQLADRGITFYVGSGDLARPYEHIIEAVRRAHEPRYNRPVHRAIRAILATGRQPEVYVGDRTHDRNLATQWEADLIKYYGIENLCNVRPPCKPRPHREQHEAVMNVRVNVRTDFNYEGGYTPGE